MVLQNVCFLSPPFSLPSPIHLFIVLSCMPFARGERKREGERESEREKERERVRERNCPVCVPVNIDLEAEVSLDDVVERFRINWVWMPPWGPERITDDGRDMMRALGFAI